MAEPKLDKFDKTEKKPHPREEIREEALIRIAGNDIPASKNVYVGLTKIKGVSWGISNLVCIKLGIEKSKKFSELEKKEIEKIEIFLKNPDLPAYLMNRRSDVETGKSTHLVGTALDLAKDFDIRRMKKIRSYKGVRHIAGQPVRGQRTRSHFRKKGQPVARTRQMKEAKAFPAGGKK